MKLQLTGPAGKHCTTLGSQVPCDCTCGTYAREPVAPVTSIGAEVWVLPTITALALTW